LKTFLELIKFSHTIFALPFALVATFWASAYLGQLWPGWARLGLILVCMVCARTFAMTFNRLVDRAFDAKNPRTAKRPSVTGEVSVGTMRLIIIACVIGFMAACAGFYFLAHNIWPLVLGLPVLAWLGIYSLTKRFTPLCHFWLGISLGLAPVSAMIAIAGGINAAVLLLGLAVTFWVAGFDILYALQDEEFDRANGLKSMPVALGRTSALWLSRVCHVLAIAALLNAGLVGQFGLLYWLGVIIAAALLIVEQSLVSPRDISKINIAFMTVNGIVGLVFGSLAILDVLIR